jgi:glycosyltransferase involved in cell wall biosynthesis
MSSTAPTSSIVIPVYNEAESLDELVASVDAATSSLGTSCEIVFVDDGSTDGSFRKLQARWRCSKRCPDRRPTRTSPTPPRRCSADQRRRAAR